MIDDARLDVITDEELARRPFDELVVALQQTVQRLEGGNAGLEESIKLYKQILQSYPQYQRADEATFYLGQALADTTQTDAANAEFAFRSAALSFDAVYDAFPGEPRPVWLRQLHADALRERGESEAAATCYRSLAGPGATLHARVWDVAPDGTALLVTRGTYRLDTLADGDPDAPAGTVRVLALSSAERLPSYIFCAASA